MKKKVLIFAPFFTPSVKGGGPIISTKNLIDNLSSEIDFYVITSDRDLGDKEAFRDVQLDTWINQETAKVYYTDSSKLTIYKLSQILREVTFDSFYFNSFFDFRFTILPLITLKIFKIKGDIVIAPRGEFSPGALGLKTKKKKLYIQLFKQLNFHKKTIWHATAESEKSDLISQFGDEIRVNIANNLTENYSSYKYDKELFKETGSVSFIFISRIHPKKNLLEALRLLKKIRGNVNYSIYGPIEDKSYWNKCKEVINDLPDNIKIQYGGTVPHHEIHNTFLKNHFFLFPTLGENFGHVISEALIAGCPVIISDQTPWRNLEQQNVGWDIALKDHGKFIEALQKCVDMPQKEYNDISETAFNFGKSMANKTEDIENTLKLFS